MELLVLGVDGLDPRIVEYLLQKGRMKTVAQLSEDKNGDYGKMASRCGNQPIPHTGPAWLTIYTGQTERKHGVTTGGWIEGDSIFTEHYSESVFSALVDEGYRVGTAFMANTYPAHASEEDESWMISGYPSTGDQKRLVSPSSLVEYLPEDFERLQARTLVKGDSETTGEKDEDHIAPVDDWIAADRRKRKEIVAPLVDDRPVDVLFYGTQITDVMGHRCKPIPPYTTGVARRVVDRVNTTFGTAFQSPRLNSLVWNSEFTRAYEYVDHILSWFNDLYNPARILLLSDHGYRLDAENHAFVGTSLVYGGINRPESIIEVSDRIFESMDIGATTHADGANDSFSSSERAEIEEQLSALGYKN